MLRKKFSFVSFIGSNINIFISIPTFVRVHLGILLDLPVVLNGRFLCDVLSTLGIGRGAQPQLVASWHVPMPLQYSPSIP